MINCDISHGHPMGWFEFSSALPCPSKMLRKTVIQIESARLFLSTWITSTVGESTQWGMPRSNKGLRIMLRKGRGCLLGELRPARQSWHSLLHDLGSHMLLHRNMTTPCNSSSWKTSSFIGVSNKKKPTWFPKHCQVSQPPIPMVGDLWRSV